MSRPNSSLAVSVSQESIQLIPTVSEDCTIQITNASFVPIMFRLLTTSPHRYLVRSSRGVISPCSSEAVNISLYKHHHHHHQEDATRTSSSSLSAGSSSSPVTFDTNCSDDFKLEYCAVGPNDVIDAKLSNVVELIKKAPKDQVFKKILKVKVVVPEGYAAKMLAAAEGGKNTQKEEHDSTVTPSSLPTTTGTAKSTSDLSLDSSGISKKLSPNQNDSPGPLGAPSRRDLSSSNVPTDKMNSQTTPALLQKSGGGDANRSDREKSVLQGRDSTSSSEETKHTPRGVSTSPASVQQSTKAGGQSELVIAKLFALSALVLFIAITCYYLTKGSSSE